MSKVFFDTNILVYAADHHDPQKQNKARSILKEAANSAIGVISTQVLQEFIVTITKKMNIPPLRAKEMAKLYTNFETVTITPNHIYDATDIQLLHQLSFWDSLIVSAAQSAKCTTLYTEDLHNGQAIGQVQIHNPFL